MEPSPAATAKSLHQQRWQELAESLAQAKTALVDSDLEAFFQHVHDSKALAAELSQNVPLTAQRGTSPELAATLMAIVHQARVLSVLLQRVQLGLRTAQNLQARSESTYRPYCGA